MNSKTPTNTQTSPDTHRSGKKSKKKRPARNTSGGNDPRSNAGTIQKYPDMWDAYREKQSINHVAKSVGISWETARRAVRRGWPRLDLPPLEDRYLELCKEIERESKIDLQTRIDDTLRLARDSNRITEKVLRQIQLVDVAKIFSEKRMKKADPVELLKYLERIVSLLERTAKLELLLEGKATSRTETVVSGEVEVKHTVPRFSSMTDEALDEYLQRAVEVEAQAVEREVGDLDAVDDNVARFAEELLEAHRPAGPLLPAQCGT